MIKTNNNKLYVSFSSVAFSPSSVVFSPGLFANNLLLVNTSLSSLNLNKRAFSSSLPSPGALKNLNLFDNYVEYDHDGYEIEHPIDYEEREYYVARYELVKAYAALIKNSDLTSKMYPFNPKYLNRCMDNGVKIKRNVNCKTGLSSKSAINK